MIEGIQLQKEREKRKSLRALSESRYNDKIELDTSFLDEKEGQYRFYNMFGIEPKYAIQHWTDGIWNGCLLEFKLNYISNWTEVLKQMIRYQSANRNNGRPVLAKMIAIDLSSKNFRIYDTVKYMDYIETYHLGIRAEDWARLDDVSQEYNFCSDSGYQKLQLELCTTKPESSKYCKIHIGESNIIAWSKKFYYDLARIKGVEYKADGTPKMRFNKEEFFNEIERPTEDLLKNYIYPWQEYKHPFTNQEWITGELKQFSNILDVLNDKYLQAEYGAYYTPPAYCKIVAEMVERAVAEVKNPDKYVILDRCAGTGNLEMYLTEEQLRHCWLNTIELKEWQALKERYEGRVACISPTDMSSKDVNGMLQAGNALAVEVLDMKGVDPVKGECTLKELLDDPEYTIIGLENPPYAEVGGKAREGTREYTIVHKTMLEKRGWDSTVQRVTTDYVNQFIWSFNYYYFRNSEDQYIVLSPCKYFKSIHLIYKKFEEGFAFNKGMFKASPGVVSCVRWKNIEEKDRDIFNLINADDLSEVVPVKKVWNQCNKLFVESTNKTKCRIESNGFVLNARMHSELSNSEYNNGHRKCYLGSDNMLYMIPLYLPHHFIPKDWTQIDSIFTTSDGGTAYQQDESFLVKCLIWSCLSRANQCYAFNKTTKLEDGTETTEFIQNEITLWDGSVARKILGEHISVLDESDKLLLEIWDKIQNHVRRASEYNLEYNYGINQIIRDIDIYQVLCCKDVTEDTVDPKTLIAEIMADKSLTADQIRDKMSLLEQSIDSIHGKPYWVDKKDYEKEKAEGNLLLDTRDKEQWRLKYPELHAEIIKLPELLNNYMKNEIQPKLFQYQLLK